MDYTSSTAGVVVTLNDTADGSASDGLGGTDVLRNIEGVRGSAFNDTLTGSDSAVFESFEGREGNDSIDGKGGVDRADYQNSKGAVTVNLAGEHRQQRRLWRGGHAAQHRERARQPRLQ